MKTMLLAASTVLSLGIGSAYAGDGDGYSATTLFTSIAGEAAAPVHARSAPQGGQATLAYVTSSKSGTWLYEANQNQGGNN